MHVEVVGVRFFSNVDHQLTASTPHSDVSIVKRPTIFGVGRIIGLTCLFCLNTIWVLIQMSAHPERKTAATRYGFSRQAISRSGLVRSVVQM
jgi:hypothetical protein